MTTPLQWNSAWEKKRLKHSHSILFLHSQSFDHKIQRSNKKKSGCWKPLCVQNEVLCLRIKGSFAFKEFHCVYGFCAGQLCLHRTALCLCVLCRTALPSQDCTVSMGSTQDSFAFVGLHCVHGFCAEGQLCLQRVPLYIWLLCDGKQGESSAV